MTKIALSKLTLNGGTQPRADLIQAVVDDYAEAMRNGAVFPAVIVFHDGVNHYLADGFHRVAAAKLAGLKKIEADIGQGTQRDAVLFSVGANAEHGQRRTRDDMRRALMTLLNDPEWFQWSDHEIARYCKVHHSTVAKYRPESSLAKSLVTTRTFTTKHGTKSTMNTAGIGSRPARVGGFDPDEDQPPGNPETPATDPRRLTALTALYLQYLGGKEWVAPNEIDRTLRGLIPLLVEDGLVLTRRFGTDSGSMPEYQLSDAGCALIGKPPLLLVGDQVRTRTGHEGIIISIDQGGMMVETVNGAREQPRATLIKLGSQTPDRSAGKYDAADPDQNPLLETHPVYGGEGNPAFCPGCGDYHPRWKPIAGAFWRCQVCGDEVRDDAMTIQTQTDRDAEARMGRRRNGNGKHSPEALIQPRFGVLLIDPPWRFEVYSRDTGLGRSAESHYDTMCLDDLMALPMQNLMADDCAVFMWTTWPTLPEVLQLGAAWGLAYKTCAFNWVKMNKIQSDVPFTGMGYWTRANSEPCLLFTRGNPRRESKAVSQILLDWEAENFQTETIATPIGAHSEKPIAVYERIEALVNGPYCEVFARQARAGWTAVGNEIDGRSIQEVLADLESEAS